MNYVIITLLYLILVGNMGDLVRLKFGSARPANNAPCREDSEARAVDTQNRFLRELDTMRGRFSSNFGESMPEVFDEMDRVLESGRINEKVAEISKATQGHFTLVALESALNIVRGYENDDLRKWLFESDSSQWLKKPSFFKALSIIAKERFSVM
jgi:hypothetical protein